MNGLLSHNSDLKSATKARDWGVSSERQNNGWLSAGLLARLVGSGLPVPEHSDHVD